MITLGVGAGEGAAPVQEGCLFDMIALGVDAGGWGGEAAPLIREECLFDMIALEVGADGGAYWRGALVYHNSLEGGRLFRGGSVLERRRLFEEIR